MRRVLLLLVLLSVSISAGVITDASSIQGAQTINFSQFGNGFLFSDGPIQIGNPVGLNIQWVSTNSGSIVGNGNVGLGTNGSWNVGRAGFVGLNASTGSMDFIFASPVAVVGGFINYIPNRGNVIITAFDSGGNILEVFDITANDPIVTPGTTNNGEFFGFARAVTDIASFRVSNAFVLVDDLTFSSIPAVPEASTVFAFLLGFVFLGFIRVPKFG